MAIFKAFHGLLPKPEQVAAIAAVPYDVVNTNEAYNLAKGNPLSFLRVSRPEIELPLGTDIHANEVYEKAAQNFKRLCVSAPLEIDSENNLYIYALTMNGRTQVGIAGLASTEEYDSNVIKKHETTRRDKEDDRAKHVMTLRSQTGPVFLTYRDNESINQLLHSVITTNKPYFDFTAEDGIRHQLWKAGEGISDEISNLFLENIPNFYIADGHHRAASASRAAATCRSMNPNHTGKEDYNFFLAVAFPASELRILPYNRALKDLNGLSESDFLKKVGKEFDIVESSAKEPTHSGTFCMYFQNKWFTLTPKFNISNLSPVDILDVSILQQHILSPILGIEDPRTSKRIDFIGGIRGTAELERICKNGTAVLCFSMYPTTLEQLMSIADAGSIMPPKSTWFEPKLRDGLVCHNF